MNQITASTMLNRVEDEKNESIRYTSIFFHKYNIGGEKARTGFNPERNILPAKMCEGTKNQPDRGGLQALVRLDTYFFGVISLFSLGSLIFGVCVS